MIHEYEMLNYRLAFELTEKVVLEDKANAYRAEYLLLNVLAYGQLTQDKKLLIPKLKNVIEEKPKPKITYESKQENQMQESRHNRQFRDKCMDYIAHVKGCKSCYNAIINDMKPSVTDNIQTLLHDNKDMIVLVLMGMFILLFFSLVNNITKN
jgi:hypothetical protein